MMCIYLRTNLVNGKQYVGQANNFKQREYDWKKRKKQYAGSYINNAREKYGIENWTVEILKECSTQDELNEWEQYYIKELNTKVPNGYNLTDGGGGKSGYIVSQETREKLSESHKGIGLGKKRPEFAEKMKGEKNPFYGKTHSQETIAKIIAANKGRTAHNKGKTYEEQFGEEKANEFRKKCVNNAVKTIQCDLNGNVIKIWDSAKKASKELGIEYTGICRCRKGEFKTYHGFKWLKGD